MRQTFRGPLLILEIPGPFQTVPFGQTDGGIHLLLCFGHGRSHIPATHRELHGTKACMIVAENQQRAGNGPYFRQFLDGYHRPIHCRHKYFPDFFLVLPEFRFITYHDVELAFIFVQQRSRLSADGHFDNGLHILFGHPVTCQTSLVQFYTQLRLPDVPNHSQVLNSFDRTENLVDFHGNLFRTVQILPEYLHGNGAFHPRSRLFHIIRNGLGEIEVYARIHRKIFLHLLDQLHLVQSALPLFFGINVHVELDIIESRRIRTVVRPPGLGKHLFHFGISGQSGPHLVGQLYRLVQRNALWQSGTDINGSFIQLGQEFRPQQSKHPQTAHGHDTGNADGYFPMGMAFVEKGHGFPVDETHKEVVLLAHVPFQQHGRHDRNQGQREQQSSQQSESQSVCQRGEHLPFHFLEGEDRYQRSDNNEFGEKHGAGFLFGRLPDKPHFRHQVESGHPHFFGFPVECHEYPFHHDDRPVDNNTEVYGPHGEQVGRHAHDPQTNKSKQ